MKHTSENITRIILDSISAKDPFHLDLTHWTFNCMNKAQTESNTFWFLLVFKCKLHWKEIKL